MKQIIQRLNSKLGVELMEMPAPVNDTGHVIIKTTRTLVSKGTESKLVEFGNASYLGKARQKPDRLKALIKRFKDNGIINTISSVRDSFEQYIALGYCNCGIVVESSVNEFKTGDRVISNGPHAEIVRVPANLVAKIPDDVTDDEAVFTVVGSIGLQGMRLCNPTFGENIIVFGLGLVGLITIQLLKANGINVVGIDIDENKCKLAKNFGIETLNPKKDNIEDILLNRTNNIGVDGVIITAASESDEIISKSAQISRKKGRIILVGVVGLNINREDFYEKELIFQVSCSYGPGRYDKKYEEEGIDYPLPYVRWTEKRNFETFLDTIKNGKIELLPLITEKVKLDKYKEIYDKINSSDSIASLLIYPEDNNISLPSSVLELKSKNYKKNKPVIGIIGAGNFTKAVVLPNLIENKSMVKSIASSKGLNSTYLAKKYNLDFSTTDYKNILNDKDINTVIITSRHDSHAKFVLESLSKGKNVFVEKPLALNNKQFEEIIEVYNSKESSALMVGFNRRFSSHALEIKKQIKDVSSPINIIANMNAGFVPSDNWVNKENIGGGRIIGEACHLIDLCIFFTNSLVSNVCMSGIESVNNEGLNEGSILLKFKNNSNAVINYFTNGAEAYQKERVEIYSNKRTFIIDDYKNSYSFGDKTKYLLKNVNDKGHKNQFYNYVNAINNGLNSPIDIKEIINCTKTTFACVKSFRKQKWISIS